MQITVGTTSYEVEKSESGNYLLTGKRGAVYGLLRNRNNPSLLFPVNLSRRTMSLPQNLEGQWFTDRDGVLAVR